MNSPLSGPEGLLESRILFDSSLDAVIIATPSGAIVAANPAACALLGSTEAELCRIGREGVVDPADPRFAEALAVREQTGRFRGELTFVRASGERFPVEVATSLVHGPQGAIQTVLVFRDITERQRTEAALRASEERFAKAFHTSPDGITISRLSDGRYIEVNRGFTALSGYEASEVLGRTSVELGVWIDSRDRDAFVAALGAHGEVVNLEMDFRFKGGVIKNTLVSARLMDLNGEACVLSTTRDMTERKLAEAQLALEKARLAESLLRTQKLESLGLLAGGIAHDFNNMLGGIFGFLELAKNHLAAGHADRVPGYLDRALGVHGRARGLTQQLLTFAKGGAPVRKSLALEPLLRHNVAFALSGSNVTCLYDLGTDLWPCEGDENQLGQVIDNLVLNAKQAMPEGGEITVSARNRENPDDHAGSFVELSFADQGWGIPPENLSRIFDPFFSTKETGHGLGLATVFSIVRRHDGWVDVESEPGRGSTFHVFLPASVQAPDEGGAGGRAEHRGSGRVLVLDDEDFLREVLSDLLECLGYQAVTCRRGDEAVRLYTQALEAGQPFSAAILDLTIPGDQGGAEAARAIRQAHSEAVLVASSGYSDSPIFHRPEDFGFSGRLAKPYLRADVADLLARVLAPAVKSLR